MRALDGKDGQVGADLEVHGKTITLQLQPVEHLGAGSGVGDQAVAVFRTVHDQVVDHPALRLQQRAVQRLAGVVEAGHVVGQQTLQPGSGVATIDIDHGHVGNIEHPAIAAHLMVLLDLRAIVQGHVPATEIDRLGAKRQVQVIQKRALSHGFLLPGVASGGGR
ncbi:hypothetical protein D3C72_957210 [compost metagenome]